jgi:prepilin-type processing-associated H-X9-DG protein
MLLPALAAAKRRAYNANCTSNMRQIGMGVTLFAGDNEDYLPPGPNSNPVGLGAGQTAAYSSTVGQRGPQQLVYNIATYLGAPAPAAPLQTCSIFLCPAALANNPMLKDNLSNAVVYCVISRGATNSAGAILPWDPFGYTSPAARPHKLTELTASVWGGVMPWMLTDVDCWVMGTTSSPWGGSSVVPLLPAHGKARNYVFFDAHVEGKNSAKPGLSSPF